MPRIRLRLTFPTELIQEPIVYRLVKDFDLVINIRRADVKADHGWIALDLEGDEGRSSGASGGSRTGACRSIPSSATSSSREHAAQALRTGGVGGSLVDHAVRFNRRLAI